MDFKSRIVNGDLFREFIPDFRYWLVPLRKYSNRELLEKRDEISLAMVINRMQTREDIMAFRQLPHEVVDEILKGSPDHLVQIIADILLAFLLKENVPDDEAESMVDKVKEKKVAQLFENMEKMDIQLERRNTKEQRERAERAEAQIEKLNQKLEEKNKELLKLHNQTEQEITALQKQLADLKAQTEK